MPTHVGKRRSWSVVLIMLVWLGLGLAAPIVMSLYSSDLSMHGVEASPGDTFAISQPVVLALEPHVKLERGTVMFVDHYGKPVAHLPSGAAVTSTHILLDHATLSIAGATGGKTGLGESLAPLVQALAASRYDTLSLRRSTILLNPFGEGSEPVTDVRAEISNRRKGGIAVKGTGQIRGQKVSFDVVAGGPVAERGRTAPARLPIKLSLKGAQIDAQLDGRLTLGPQLALHGPGELTIQSGRQVARWLGAYWPTGPGLREISAKGQVSVEAQTFAFDKATFRMDGNEATGVMALRLGNIRPLLSGTLAFKAFDAKSYLAAAPGEPRETLNWASLTAGALTVPLGMHLDADVRVSAARVQIAGLELGQSAATIALKDGRLLADLAELRFNGGNGRGQIGADFTGFTPKISIRGKLDNVDLGRLSSALTGQSFVQAPATIVADLSGGGTTLNDLLRGMSGRINAKSQLPGRLGIDLKALAASSRNGVTTGWGTAARGATAFDGLDLKLVLRDGSLLTETAETQSADGGWAATGVINLPSNRIDLRLFQVPSSQHGAVGGVAVKAAVLDLQGPWDAPLIKPAADQTGGASMAPVQPN